MDIGSDSARGLFAGVDEFPDSEAGERFHSLLGIDALKEQVVRHAEVILAPHRLKNWAEQNRLDGSPLLSAFRHRTPLLVFAGDVGTGKSALAETFGNEVARRLHLPVTLYRLSLSARGSGAVGEMTQLLAAAFEEVGASGRRLRRSGSDETSGGIVFVIDEADALAQSRELAQMHHEDRAGVNELIRGIDDLGRDAVPVLVVMCTNRLSALDPAIRRRAAEIFVFDRPNDEQRRALLNTLFHAVLKGQDLEALVQATGPQNGCAYGFTYSDIAHRLVSAAVLDAYPHDRLAGARIVKLAERLAATKPFESELS
jgi:AAA+ superfamily predicted ATPase